MAYETEAIAPNTAAIPTQAMPVMREERLVNPYQTRAPKPETSLPLPQTGQADTTRSEVPVEPRPIEETVKLSPQVSALARREQKFRLQQQELEKAKAAIETEKAEIAQLKAMKEKLAAKDYSSLEGLIDYNEYSQYQVNKLNGTDPVQEEIKKLNGKISGLEKNAEEHVNRQYEAAVSERRNAVTELVTKSTEYPRTKKANAHEAVVQHILDTWEHDSVELSVEQAAKEVEEALSERARQWASLLEEDKVASQPSQTEEKKELPPLKPGLKTLTNQVTAGDIKSPRRSLQHLSDTERWAEARRRAEEKLNQRTR